MTWHADFMITMGMLGTIVVNAGIGIWWLSQLSATTAAHSRQIAVLEVSFKERGKRLESLVRLDSDMRHVRQSVGRLEASLEKLSDRTRFTAAPRDRTRR